MTEVRLNELDKIEWFDVVRQLDRDLTWEEFSLYWTEFQAKKALKAASTARKALS